MAIQDKLFNRNKSILERRFIDQVLEEEGKNIVNTQNRLDLKYKFKTDRLKRARSINVSGGRLVLEHSIIQRFVDMNKVRGITKKKKTPIHNKVIFGHFNNILGRLRFGFTRAIQQQLSNEHKIEING